VGGGWVVVVVAVGDGVGGWWSKEDGSQGFYLIFDLHVRVTIKMAKHVVKRLSLFVVNFACFWPFSPEPTDKRDH
jgi:hypothetical protein